jgi:uncharacterized heparinase superfamily protein
MASLAQARRYWHTLSHLRPSQAAARADLRLRAAWRRLRPEAAAARYLRRGQAAGFTWPADPWGLRGRGGDAARFLDAVDRARLAGDAADLRERRFTFLNETATLAADAGTIDWRVPAATQLWRYHLHYFDGLPEAIAVGEPWAPLEALARDWIRGAPLGAASARDAWHSYVVSLRIVNWLLALAAADDAPGEEVRRSLAQQIVFVERNLERDVGGNHLLKNLKALAIAGTFAGGSGGARLRARFVPAFVDELRAQLRSDGGHYEQSPMYHVQVLMDAIEVALALRLMGEPPPAALADTLAAMRRFLRHVCHPDGQIAQFGDSAFNMTAPPRQVMAGVALALGEPDAGEPLAARHALAAARLWPARAAVPTVPAAVAPYEAASVGVRPPVADPASSGFFVIGTGDGRGHLVADAGPVCPDDLPAHAHSDLFGFEVSVDGERLIVDTGVSEYRAGRWRTFERSTRAHSTVVVDGAEQSDCWGSFRVARRARVTACSTIDGADGSGFVARHDGYRQLDAPADHTRQITRVGDVGWLIVDRLDGPGRHRWETFLHFHPDAHIDPVSPGAWSATRGRAVLHVRTFGIGAATIVRGALDPPQGWYAPEFGRRLPAPVLVAGGEGPLPAVFGWLLSIDAPATAKPAGGADAVDVVAGDRRIRVPMRTP